MKNYAAGDPVGNNQQPIRVAPAPYKAINAYADENSATSSVLTLTPNTTAIEVAAAGFTGFIRWIGVGDTEGSVFANASVMNYDHVIPVNTVRRFVVPIEVAGGAMGVGSLVGANIENGLYRRVAYRAMGIGSVFLSEYGSSNSY